MKRRVFLFAGALAALDWRMALAQVRPARIGMLSARSLAESPYAAGVMKRLQALGYLRQRGAGLEFRSADGDVARYPKLARELIDAKCDLIFAIGPAQTALALRDTASRAPIVFLAVDYDPVERGVVSSLRNPGANVTGVYIPQSELDKLYARYAVPAFVPWTSVVETGILISYTTNISRLWQRAAQIGAQILKGAKPGDIPVEQPSEFDLIVNLKTARALGIKVPYSILSRATKVVE